MQPICFLTLLFDPWFSFLALHVVYSGDVFEKLSGDVFMPPMCTIWKNNRVVVASQLVNNRFLSDHVQDFCWIHGTRFIDKETRVKLQKSLGNTDFNPYCDIEASEADKAEAGSTTDLNPDTVYYQWVPIIFLLNAVMFSIPFYCWNWAEGGFIETFNLPKNQSSKVCEEFETKREDLR